MLLMCLCMASANLLGQERKLRIENNGFKWYELVEGAIVGAQSHEGVMLIPLDRGYTLISYMYYLTGEGYFRVDIGNKKYGVCDESGREIVAPGRYNYAAYRLADGYEYIDVLKHGKKGACDMDGCEIIEPKYESLISRNGGFKYKDNSGKWVSLGVDVNGNAYVDPNEAYDKYFAEGSKYFDKKNYRKAAKSYKKALEYKKTSAAYYNVGVSYKNVHNYKDAITYFQYCINSHPNASLEKKAQDRINESRQCIAQKEARNQEIAEAIIGGAIAFAAGVASASMGVSNPTTGGNTDYLLDPNYAIRQAQQQQAEFDAINQQLINLSIWQTEQQEYETYLLMTSGGTTMTFEEWKAIAAQAAMNESFNTDMSFFISDDPSEMEYKGKLSPDQYQAAYRSYENSAAGYYRALTIGGVRDQDKNGNIQGKTVGQISGGGYATWKQGLSKAQAEMRRIRQEAAQYGVTIQQSQWETATVSF